jgi:hypothetical protein
MKNLTGISFGAVLIALSSLSSLKPVSGQPQTVTCSSSAIPVSATNGRYVYEFTSTSDWAQLKICSTSPIQGRENTIGAVGEKILVEGSNWSGLFEIRLDERFDDEIDIQATMQHTGGINYTTTSVRNRSSHWLHAEGNSGSAEGNGIIVHPPCNFQSTCFRDVFTERLTWRSHQEWWDRDEIDSWTYILTAHHEEVPLIP